MGEESYREGTAGREANHLRWRSYLILRVQWSWSHRTSRLPGEGTPGGYPPQDGFTSAGVVRESCHFFNSAWPSAKERPAAP